MGIDLGTTNSAVAFADAAEALPRVDDFPIVQLTGPGLVEPRPTLPSFHYEAAAGELPVAATRLPWTPAADEPATLVGTFARDHGAGVPGRLVTSAKSWLSHSGVDRTAGLLPWHGSADVQKLSPVEVSARYLSHLRAAWDHRHPEHPLANQDVVLTVPASFDEVARELTVQAAKEAGFGSLTLVEEPQAAFYAWIAAHGSDWEQRVRPGQTILICDVGGGTTDFTLIRVRPGSDGKVLFHRVAVGEHLILGGDNLDLALADHIEKKLLAEGKPKLAPTQWGSLVRSARVVKETLLGAAPPGRTTINIAGGGSKLIGGSIRVELTRDEVERVLVDGFLPRTPLDAKPAARRSGFQEFGLPYTTDAGITRYLAAFLTSHRELIRRDGAGGDHDPARPDLVLFNGGLFESPRLRDRLLEVLTGWFADRSPGWSPVVLENRRLDLAVARGAAYYGLVRRGKGVRIRGGLAHSYYMGVETASGKPTAVCLLPAGVEEGQKVDLPDRQFDLLIRQPVEFPLYYSGTRTTDRPGELVEVDPEQLTSLPPIRTVLTSGRSAAATSVQIELHAQLTEIGTLDIWCSEAQGQRTWRLQFDVRSASQANAARHDGVAERQGVVDDATVANCAALIRAAFGKTSDPRPLMRQLESATGQTRWQWPASLLRSFWEVLIELEPARRLSAEHEARWLSLTGFSLRPGYGLAVDDWRVSQTWKLFTAGPAFHKNEQVRAEWWILWRRVAGGMTAGQQATLAEPLIADWRTYLRKQGVGVKGRSSAFQFGPHESAEVWRTLGSLELLKPAVKAELGSILLERLPREKVQQARDAILFALGRVGQRVPAYGPLNAMLDPAQAQQWTRQLLQLNPADDRAAFAVMQLTRKTGDRWRDVADADRTAAIDWLAQRDASSHLIELVRDGGTLADEEQRNVLGESLPRGLRLE
ncbi:hsp70 family protein [Humisphaera borealis]|uniref:Hsp70 family protein n=1 Tax=Humisphaera borealis TaxID=2807512 RepID=A0A7M2X446_9BACT|nr:hsp70 family protein [Humisphaera borealis]